MTQLYKEAQIKEQKLAPHDAVAKEDASTQEQHWTEQVQFKEKYYEWKLVFLKMMEKYQLMWKLTFRVDLRCKTLFHIEPTKCWSSSRSPLESRSATTRSIERKS